MRTTIYGVGSSLFGKQPALSPTALAWAATLEALRDADVEDVQAAYVGTVFGAPGVAQRVLHGLGITGVPIITVEAACASGTVAFHEARETIEQGRYDRVLALGVEQMSTIFEGPIQPEPSDAEGRAGLALPALYAMTASRYQHEFGLTADQLAMVSVKNHRHAIGNPRAQYRGELTVEQVLSSRMIADPLTLLQCSPIADGAAAAVLGSPRGHTRDVTVRSSVHRSGELWGASSPHVWGFDLVRSTAASATAAAGVEVSDIDVFEVHDAFTIGEIVTTEAIGLAELGNGALLVEAGHSALGGRQPVNPSGGLLSRGHPLGCTGLAQVAEIVWQLRGDASARQVEDARLGLVETMGGGVAGIDGNACVISVLEGGSK